MATSIAYLIDLYTDLLTPEPRWSSLAVVFVSLALAFGVTWIVIMPPFHVPDERNMFCRAYQVSEGGLWGGTRGRDPYELGFTGSERLQDTASGVVLPEVMHEVNRKLHWYEVALNPRAQLPPAYVRQAWMFPVQPEKREFYAISNALIYPPISFLPQVAGISLGRWLQLPFGAVLWLTRLANLLFYIVSVCVALWLLPTMRWPLFVIALFPICLQQAFSPSADCLQMCSSWLFLAYVLHLRQVKLKVGWQELLVLVVLAIMVACAKLVYGPLTLLVLLVPARCFGSRKRWLGGVALVVGLAFVSIMTWMLVLSLTQAPHVEQQSTNTMLQAMLQNPLLAVHYVGENILFNLKFERTWRAFVGVLGYLDTWIPLWTVVLYYLAFLGACTRTRPAPHEYPLAGPLSLLLLGLVLVALIHLALGSFVQTLYLVQPRYYLPFILLAPLAFSFSNVAAWPGWGRLRRVPAIAYCLIALLGLIVSTHTIVTRYYYW